jgi:hypothetical protein
VGRPPYGKTEALQAARKSRNHALWERNQLLKLWIHATGLIAHLEPPARPDLLFPAVLCVHTPAGQLTWRLSDQDLEDFAHLPSNGLSHWDGATASQKDDRLAELAQLAIGAPTPAQTPSEALRQLLINRFPMPIVLRIEQEAEIGLGTKLTGSYYLYVREDGRGVELERKALRKPLPRSGWFYAATLEKA